MEDGDIAKRTINFLHMKHVNIFKYLTELISFVLLVNVDTRCFF